MLSSEIKNELKAIVDSVITELKKNDLMKNGKDIAYQNISMRLATFYKTNGCDQSVKKALQDLKNDSYYDVIPMYYQDNMTIEDIAERLGVDVSTVVRNKKRLCLAIYMLIEDM